MPIHLAVGTDTEGVEPSEASLLIDVEARDYLVRAAELLEISGVSVLARLDPWDDCEFCGDELEGLVVGLPLLREQLSAALDRRAPDARLQPPKRVGFLDLGDGVPFGREGLMRLLVELQALATRARSAGQCLIALGD